MANPWDRLPLPSAGDIDDDALYTEVGRMMSAWECIEFELCMIYSAFVGDYQGEAMREYGAKRSSQYRLDDFELAAEQFFVRQSDQTLEGNLSTLLVAVRGFLSRRNEVAHGLCTPINRISFLRDHLTNKDKTPVQWAIIPPYHMVRGHRDDGLPAYAYTSSSIKFLIKRMYGLQVGLKDFREIVSQRPQKVAPTQR